MRNSLERTGVLQLSLYLLQGDDLSRRRCAYAEYLTEQSRLPDGGEREHVSTDRGFENGVAHVGRPALKILSVLHSARIRALPNYEINGLVLQQPKDPGNRRGRPVREGDALEAARETLF
jgi:hypothetical protein